MVYTKCKHCGVSLEIDENDYMPGCRETEEVKCPECGKTATTVRTSGFPSAHKIDEKQYDLILKQFDM